MNQKENKTCNKSCSPSDWHKGGKCDLNGCYYETAAPEGRVYSDEQIKASIDGKN